MPCRMSSQRECSARGGLRHRRVRPQPLPDAELLGRREERRGNGRRLRRRHVSEVRRLGGLRASRRLPDRRLHLERSCAAPSCYDNVINGSESDQDCGGTARNAWTERRAPAATTARAGFATRPARRRPAGTWSRTAAETDVDCGGPCAKKCTNGQQCAGGSDCMQGVCTNGFCQTASCNDGIRNGDETDRTAGIVRRVRRRKDVRRGGRLHELISRGPPRPARYPAARTGPRTEPRAIRIAAGRARSARTARSAKPRATARAACASPASARCLPAPTPSRTAAKRTSTAEEPPPRQCGTSLGCTVPRGLRQWGLHGQKCVAPSCNDSVKNGAETGLDCGGATSCPRCGTGVACSSGSDCVSGVCTSRSARPRAAPTA